MATPSAPKKPISSARIKINARSNGAKKVAGGKMETTSQVTAMAKNKAVKERKNVAFGEPTIVAPIFTGNAVKTANIKSIIIAGKPVASIFILVHPCYL